MTTAPQSCTTTLACDDLDATIAAHERGHGWRLDMVMPADAPCIALLSRGSERLRLERQGIPECANAAEASSALLLARAGDGAAWSAGRAGMQYRDLIPGRRGGRAIASHIRIPDGGEVPDRVHYHDVRFQVIFCGQGWVRVAYEDQGPPLVMRAGDCVLQPPFIRHRVLESSAGLEVVELACPAEHPTWIEHEIELPTPTCDPQRSFSGQRFVHHVAAGAAWQETETFGVRVRDTGIGEATAGLAGARVVRVEAGVALPVASPVFGRVRGGALFLHVLEGEASLHGNEGVRRALRSDDAITIVGDARAEIRASVDCELLAIAMPD